MEEKLMSAILEGQSSIQIEGVIFEKLPTLKRDMQKYREVEAKKKAKELIAILNS